MIKLLVRMHKLPDASVLKQAYLAEVELFLKGKVCWLQNVKVFLTTPLGHAFPRGKDAVLTFLGTLSVSKVRKAIDRRVCGLVFMAQVPSKVRKALE